MEKSIIAGPWIGEFGWELMTWQGHLRAIAENYKKVIVISRSCMKFLYEDFASKFIGFDPKSKDTTMWMCQGVKPRDYNYIYKEIGDATASAYRPEKVWLKIRRNWDKKDPIINALQPQKFIKFGNKIENIGYDLIYHARNTSKLNTGYRNWEPDSWKEFLSFYPDAKIAATGAINDSLHFPGTDDLRGIELSELANIMASSKIFVGPSSGTVHFASLCGLPRVTWEMLSDTFGNNQRHQNLWNPFDIPVVVMRGDWQPAPIEVKRQVEILKLLIESEENAHYYTPRILY